MDHCSSCKAKSDHFIIRFNLKIHLVFHLDDEGKLQAKNPGNNEDNKYIRDYLLNPSRQEMPLSGGELGARLNKFLHRKHVNEKVFRRYHVSSFQGKLSQEAKQAISYIWNSYPFCRSLANIYISPFRRDLLLKFGLTHRGNVVSLFYNSEKKGAEADSSLEIFLTQDKKIIIVRITRTRLLSLKNLAAEKIGLSISHKDNLEKLFNSNQLPNTCKEAIERCV